MPRNHRWAIRLLRGFTTKKDKPSVTDRDGTLFIEHIHDAVAVHILKRGREIDMIQLAKDITLPTDEIVERPLHPTAPENIINRKLQVDEILVHWEDHDGLSFCLRGPNSEPFILKKFETEPHEQFLVRLAMELITFQDEIPIKNNILNLHLHLSRPL